MNAPSSSARGPSFLATSSGSLMMAGVIGAHLALVAATGLAALISGTAAAVSTLLAGLTVSILWTLGQQFQLITVQRANLSGLAATLGGFGIRVLILGGALAFWLANATRFPALVDWGITLGLVAVSVGWLAGMLWRYARMHVPIYDRDYVAPAPGASPIDQR